jgi:hypothetical protein
MTRAWIIAAAALASVPGAGVAGAAPARQCFHASDIDGWTAADKATVNLRVHLRDYYQLKLAGDCQDIDWTQRIGIEHRGSNWICDRMDAVLIVPTEIGPRRCTVDSVRKLTPEEVKALPGRQRP